MKRIISFFAALAIVVVAMAQAPGITLSSGGKLQKFSPDKLGAAIEAAQPNDTIFLSQGAYDLSSLPMVLSDYNCATITKPIVIIGAGGNDNDSPNGSTSLVNHHLGIATDGNVTLEGVVVQDIKIQQANEVKLKNVHAWSLDDYNDKEEGQISANKIVMDQCYINGELCLAFFGNVMANNCYFYYIRENCIDEASFVNCNVYDNDGSSYFLNSIIFYSGLATLDNCYYYDNQGSRINSTQENHINFDDIYADPAADPYVNWLGSDGTPVGIYGGIGFTLNPSVPTPNPTQSSVTYDPNEKKVKVKVTVLGE